MKQCNFCSKDVNEVDYRDVETLKRYVSSQAKIIDPRHTGVCARHQRRLARAIKRARVMGLMPFVRQ
ncbi:MAG: 30S ribosomal protein S18 [Candidatus Jorgensenbacteria bacterium]